MSESSESSNDSKSENPIAQNTQLNPSVRPAMLRPSLFGSKLGSSSSEEPKSSLFNDAKLNPFLKEIQPETENKLSDDGDTVKTTGNEDTKRAEASDPLKLLTKNGLPKSNLFVTTKSTIPLAEGSNFVFGQNVHERVTGESVQSTSAIDNSTKAESDNSNQSSSSTSNLLFSSAIQNTKVSEKETEKSQTEGDVKSLTEVAREYEESRAQKRKYEEVETFTGEENEVNITDINCKLFAFVNANWEERGRGSLRLNDSKDDSKNSRLVFRTSGNLRLLVNTKIWPGMVAERPSQKSLRLTAMDNTGQIKIFLIMSRPNSIDIVYNALSKRIETCKLNSSLTSDSFEKEDKKNGFEKQTIGGQKNTKESEEPSSKKPVVEIN